MSKGLKIFGVILLVVVVAVVLFLVFGISKTKRDSSAATNNQTLVTSTNYLSFDANLTSKYYGNTSEIAKYASDVIQTSNPELYKKYQMQYLQYAAMWAVTQGLVGDTAFGGKESESQSIANDINEYSTKLAYTLDAIKVFNVDKASATTTAAALENEFEVVVNRLAQQNQKLADLSKKVVYFVEKYNYDNVSIAKSDLRIALLDALNQQSILLHDYITKYQKDNKTNIDTVLQDTETYYRSYLVAQKNNFNMSSISAIVDINKFVTTYSTAKNVEDMFKSESKEAYIAKVKDKDNKDDLQFIIDSITQLSEGAI